MCVRYPLSTSLSAGSSGLKRLEHSLLLGGKTLSRLDSPARVGDGNHEALEKNRYWSRRAAAPGGDRGIHGSPKQQERGHGADREGPAARSGHGGKRFG